MVGQAVDVKTLSDVWLYPTDGKGNPKPFLRTTFDERAGAVSPNGTLMAFTSDDTGTTEVYIAAFPEPGRRLKVSTSSAGFPQWNGDGTELLFRVGQRIVSVAVPRQWTGELPAVGPERVLFTLPANVNAWTVSRDGQRFLINRRVAEAAEPRPEVVVNWASR